MTGAAASSRACRSGQPLRLPDTNGRTECIGSEIALCSILRGLGKRTELSTPTPPARYASRSDTIQHRTGASFRPDLCLSWIRPISSVGNITREDFGGAKIIDIDHHPGNRFLMQTLCRRPRQN
jgi:nanoRNase/pAp phosphatase (c-di-AMP/oligoRNAs hydrolase)